MNGLTEIVPSIYRLVVPFEDIYTTVFIIKTPLGAVLLDTATYSSDIDGYVLPALTALGISADSLRYVVLSHSHRDHAGGLSRLTELFPKVCIVSFSEALLSQFPASPVLCPKDGELLLDTLQIIPVPGHAPDCLALYDLRTRALLTGDSLQLFGIYGSGKWGVNISKPAAHLSAVERLRAMDIEIIIASHDYHPCGHTACGAAEISRYLDCCGEALDRIRRFLLEFPESDDQALADRYNQTFSLPTVGSHVFAAVRNSLAK